MLNGGVCLKTLLLLEQPKNILCVSPEDPDGDSVSSVLAFRLFLQSQGKSVTLWCKDPIPDTPLMRALPGIELFTTELPQGTRFDLVVAFDYGTLERLYLPREILESVPLIGFDHHGSGSHNHQNGIAICDPHASSTTLLLYEFFRGVSHPISQDLALCLLIGLCTDTQFFRNALTTPQALRAAGDLSEKNAGALLQISQLMSPQYSRRTVNAWREALDRLEIRNDIALMWFTEGDFARLNVQYRDVAGLTGSLLNNIQDIDATALLVQEDGKWRGSLRSPRGKLNVAKIAELLGGGGHASAAGFLSSLSLDDVKETIFRAQETKSE